ncbi:MAG: DUF3267 domain-containing protein [Bacteroidota bacterium]
MNIRPRDLANLGYDQLDELGHLDLIPFVQENLRRRNLWSLSYWFANLLGIAALVYLFVVAIQVETVSFWTGLQYAGLGFIGSLLLIPVHEGIHALAYRLVGAKRTSFDANWRQFYFMAIADKFVANRREFLIVALAPFLLITLIFVGLAFVLPLNWQFAVLSLVLMHTSFCAGDFGLLSYFAFRRNWEVVTYDDRANKVSYFYGKRKASKIEEEVPQVWE